VPPTWRDGSQLAQRVRPVLGDFCVVGKPLQTARQFFRSPSGRGHLRRSGPPRPGPDRPAGHGLLRHGADELLPWPMVPVATCSRAAPPIDQTRDGAPSLPDREMSMVMP
jgi:hypothetical protein